MGAKSRALALGFLLGLLPLLLQLLALPLFLQLGFAFGGLLLTGHLLRLFLLVLLLIFALEPCQLAPGSHLLGLQRQLLQPLAAVLEHGRSLAHGRPCALRAALAYCLHA